MPAPSAVSIFLRIASARASELTSAMRRVPSISIDPSTVLSHPACFFERDLNDHLDAGGRNDLLDDDPLSASDHCRNGVAHSVDVHPQLSQHHWGRALGEAQQPQQQMLGSDVGMVRALGFFLGKCQRLLSVRREPLERIHGCGPSVPDGAVKNTCL